MSSGKDLPIFKEVLPKQGLLFSEETVQLVLCKPKILPLKSVTLEKLERMQKEAQELLKLQEAAIMMENEQARADEDTKDTES